MARAGYYVGAAKRRRNFKVRAKRAVFGSAGGRRQVAIGKAYAWAMKQDAKRKARARRRKAAGKKDGIFGLGILGIL